MRAWPPPAQGREETGNLLARVETRPPRAWPTLRTPTLRPSQGQDPGHQDIGPSPALLELIGVTAGDRANPGAPPPPGLWRPFRPLPRGQLTRRSRNHLQPASEAVPLCPPREPPRLAPPPTLPGVPRPPGRAPARRLTWRVGRAGWREAAAGRALDVRRAPGAGGDGGGSGCCRYSCRSVQLLLRRRLLPSRWASCVARRGRTKAPLPLEVSQVSSSLRRRQGRGPRPAPARQPPAPPQPYLSAPGEDPGPHAGRGHRLGGARRLRGSSPRGRRG